VAINEVALLAAEPAAVVRYSLYVNGEFIFNDMGDGCLVSTPVGSTAYALSAGGPVIHVSAQVVEVVPVNSMLRRPPHVFPADAEVELRGARSRSDILLIGDGAERIKYRDSAVVRHAGTAKLLIRAQREGPTPRLPPSALLLRKILEERGPLTALGDRVADGPLAAHGAARLGEAEVGWARPVCGGPHGPPAEGLYGLGGLCGGELPE
jgi:NAD+ kinase